MKKNRPRTKVKNEMNENENDRQLGRYIIFMTH